MTELISRRSFLCSFSWVQTKGYNAVQVIKHEDKLESVSAGDRGIFQTHIT